MADDEIFAVLNRNKECIEDVGEAEEFLKSVLGDMTPEQKVLYRWHHLMHLAKFLQREGLEAIHNWGSQYAAIDASGLSDLQKEEIKAYYRQKVGGLDDIPAAGAIGGRRKTKRRHTRKRHSKKA